MAPLQQIPQKPSCQLKSGIKSKSSQKRRVQQKGADKDMVIPSERRQTTKRPKQRFERETGKFVDTP
jgi:hypothetical protein